MSVRKRILMAFAGVGSAVVLLVANMAAASACFMYFYQPQQPSNLAARLRDI